MAKRITNREEARCTPVPSQGVEVACRRSFTRSNARWSRQRGAAGELEEADLPRSVGGIQRTEVGRVVRCAGKGRPAQRVSVAFDCS